MEHGPDHFRARAPGGSERHRVHVTDGLRAGVGQRIGNSPTRAQPSLTETSGQHRDVPDVRILMTKGTRASARPVTRRTRGRGEDSMRCITRRLQRGSGRQWRSRRHGRWSHTARWSSQGQYGLHHADKPAHTLPDPHKIAWPWLSPGSRCPRQRSRLPDGSRSPGASGSPGWRRVLAVRLHDRAPG